MTTDTLVDEVTLNASQLAAAIEAHIPNETRLVHVHYGDRLTPKQIEMHFMGASDQNAVENEVLFDLFDESRYVAAMREVEDAFREARRSAGWDLDWDEATRILGDELDELRYLVEGRDQSDPYGDLLSRTPQELFRYDLDFPGDTFVFHTNDGSGLVSDIVDHLVSECGFDGDVEPLYADVQELVGNAIETYGKLQIIFYEQPYTLIGPCNQVHWATRTEDDFTVTVTNPHLLLIDTWSGAGHEVKITGKLTMPFAVERVILDSMGGTYGWNDVCGLHGPAYAGDFTIHDAKEEQ